MTVINRIDTRNVLPMEANYSVSVPAIEAKFHALEILVKYASWYPNTLKALTGEAYRRVTELHNIVAPTVIQGGDDMRMLRNELDGARYFADPMMIRHAYQAASDRCFSARYFWYRTLEYSQDRELYLLQCKQDHQHKVDVQRWGERFVTEAREQAAQYEQILLSDVRDGVLDAIKWKGPQEVAQAVQAYEEAYTHYLAAYYRHSAMQELYA